MVRPGHVMENPVAGETRIVFTKSAQQTGGEVFELEVLIRAGAPGTPEMVHSTRRKRTRCWERRRRRCASGARNNGFAVLSSGAFPTETVGRRGEKIKPLIIGATIGPGKEARGEEDKDVVLRTTRFLNLLLAGVLTGNEFGGFVGFHPALYELPTEAHARAERAITSRFGKLMPPFMTTAIVL